MSDTQARADTRTRVAIASDHAGFEQKQQLAAWLAARGLDVRDLGPATDERVDYPLFAALVAEEVAGGAADLGVLVCGTGIGMAMAANKTDGIRAANITSPAFAALAREHNDANVITLSGRFVDVATNEAILAGFLDATFGGGRHADRVALIRALEHQREARQTDEHQRDGYEGDREHEGDVRYNTRIPTRIPPRKAVDDI
jgi:ribose 5-phosphate isomerase B